MKNIIYILGFLMVISLQTFAQSDDGPPHHMKEMREKILQLEKIKLIETLQMNEETTLRFFARRSETESTIDSLRENLDKKIDEIDKLISDDNKPEDNKLKSLVREVSRIRLKIEQKRADFVNSLDDILTIKQIAKFVVFEKKFREELAKSLIKDRMRNKRN